MLALLLAFLQPLACHAIHSDWIQGRDLASALAIFSKLDPDLKLGLAPYPGQQRLYRARELKRIAAAQHIEGEFTEDICFAWDLSVPAKDQILAAMRQSLQGRKATIDIVESSLMSAPKGEIIFPLSGLSIGSDKPSFWRGYVRYAGAREFPIWARVVVKVREQHVIAATDLHYGDTVVLDQVKVASYEGPIQREKFVLDAAPVAGFLLKRPVSAGTALTEDMLEAPREVNQGEVVTAIVQTGAALLEVKGIAEVNGRKGQIISVRNPRSGRTFHARVEDKGTVVVVPGGQFGLVVEPRKS